MKSPNLCFTSAASPAFPVRYSPNGNASVHAADSSIFAPADMYGPEMIARELALHPIFEPAQNEAKNLWPFGAAMVHHSTTSGVTDADVSVATVFHPLDR